MTFQAQGQKTNPKPQPRKSDKCRVVIKKRKNGDVVKEISGSCSREKLEALKEE